jgi:hypothetical protein
MNGNGLDNGALHRSVSIATSTRSSTGLGEEAPLLGTADTALTESFIDSTRSTESSSAVGGYFGFSSHWLDTANVERQETFQSERERAVEQGIVQAAFLIRDAVLGESENPSQGTYDPYLYPENSIRNLFSLVFRQILAHRPLRNGLIAAVWIQALLTFIEPPRWCSKGFRGDQDLTCHALFRMNGPAAGSNTTSEEDYEYYYPSSHSLFLTLTQSHIIEWICLVFISAIMLCRIGRDGCSLTRYLRKSPAQRVRIIQLVSIVVLFFGLCTGKDTLQPFARLTLLGTFVPSLHLEVKTTLKVLPEVMNVFLLLVIFMVFWAFFGTVMFYQSDEGHDSFPSLIESLWTLWICVTTANYPDVMMPSYNKNRLTGIFFVVFMIISFFFFMNLILSSVVNTYDDVMDARKKSQRLREDTKLTQAFYMLDHDGTGNIDRNTVMTLFRILNKDFPEFRHISQRDAKLLYAILDRDGSSVIHLEEFLDFGSILLLEFFNEEEFATFVQNHFPELYNSPGYQVSGKLTCSNWDFVFIF